MRLGFIAEGADRAPIAKAMEDMWEEAVRTLHPAPYTPHPTPYTLHSTPYTLHPTPYTLRVPCTRSPIAKAMEDMWEEAVRTLHPTWEPRS
jgi:hypothetical protein